jgi:hypothetical protein
LERADFATGGGARKRKSAVPTALSSDDEDADGHKRLCAAHRRTALPAAEEDEEEEDEEHEEDEEDEGDDEDKEDEVEEVEVENRCTICDRDLGPQNPRQHCEKSYCPHTGPCRHAGTSETPCYGCKPLQDVGA